MSATKVYRKNYKHKHKLKDIKSIVEKHLDPKFEFEVKDVYKSFTFKDKSDRFHEDWGLSNNELLKIKDNVYLSYTIELKKEKPIYTEHNLEGYIELLENLVDMSKEFEKHNLFVLPNTVDDDMDIDVIEGDLFSISMDNYDIYDFIQYLQEYYQPLEGRQYQVTIDYNKFYNIKLESTYRSKNEHNLIENVKHFEKYLKRTCIEKGYNFIKNKNKTYNIYTKGQYRDMNIKNIFKK